MPVLRLAVILALVFSTAITVQAQPKELRVPFDRIEEHLTRDHVPIDAAEYARLLEQTVPRPSLVRIDRADYSARLFGSALQIGRVQARVTNDADSSQLLRLDPFNLSVTALNWSRGAARRPAIWGTTPDGKIVLLVDPGSHQLEGTWQTQGTKLPGNVEFDLKLMPSAISNLTIETSQTQVVTSTAALVSKLDTNGDAKWKVAVGNHAGVQLTIRETKTAGKLPPTALFESTLSYLIRNHESFLNASFVVDAVNDPVDQLEILMSPDWEILSARYGGDLELNWKRASETAPTVNVTLPSPIIGRTRAVQIRAIRLGAPAREWRNPAISVRRCRLANSTQFTPATFMRGGLNLSVAIPLKTRSLDSTGFLQRQPVLVSDDSESFAFEQTQPNSRLSVSLLTPAAQLETRITGFLTADDQNWKLTSLVEWSAKNGAAYSVECRLPIGWDVLEVRNQTAESKLHWEIVGGARSPNRRLRIETPVAISSGNPLQVRISTRSSRKSDQTRFKVSFPVLLPTVGTVADRTLAAQATAIGQPRWTSNSYKPVERATLSERIASQFDKLGATSPGALIVSSGNEVAPVGVLEVVDRTQPVRATASTRLELSEDKLTENCEIEATPSEPIRRLLVFVSTNSNQEIDWRVADANVSLTAVKRTPDEHADWDLPVAGELWELRFEHDLEEPFHVTAHSSRETDTIEFVSVYSVVNAESFHGLLILDDIADRIAELTPFEMQKVNAVADVRDTSDIQWSYGGPSARLRVRFDSARADELPTARLVLQSRLVSNAGGKQFHTATYELDEAASRQPFQFSLPATCVLQAVHVNGKAVTAERRDDAWHLPPIMSTQPIVTTSDSPTATASPAGDVPEAGDADSPHTIELRYSCSLGDGWLSVKQEIAVPKIQLAVVSARWELTLRNPEEPWRVSGGISFLDDISQDSWTRRMFGPLGRTAEQTLFRPHHISDWLELMGRGNSPAANKVRSSGGWRTWTVVDLDLPNSIQLRTWNRLESQRMGWIALLCSLGVGALLRSSRMRWRSRIGATWLAFALTGVLFVPLPFADIAGGCLTGSLVAALIPRRLLRKPRRKPKSNQEAVGKAEEQQQIVIKLAGILLLVGLFSWNLLNHQTASAQDEVRPKETTATPQPAVGSAVPIRNTVIRPVGGLPIVYVPRAVLTELRQQSRALEDVDYVISRAAYTCDVGGQNSVSVLANYQVALLKPAGSLTRIRLPISGAVLAGEGSCTVNDEPHPILPAQDGDGFLLEVEVPRAARIGVVSEPAAEPSPTAPTQPPTDTPDDVASPKPSSPTPRQRVQQVDIKLRMLSRIEPIATGGRVSIGIPKVPSDVSASVDERFATIAITGAAIQTNPNGSRLQATGTLAPIGILRVGWSTEQAAIEEPPEVNVSAYTIAEMLPARVRYHVFASYDIQSGEVRNIEWQVPKDVVLREFRAGTESKPFLVPETGRVRLIAALTEPRTEPFSVYARFDKPLKNSRERIRLPVIDPSPGLNAEAVVSQQIGIATTSPFETTATAQPDGTWTPIDVDEFRADVLASIEGIPIVPPVVQSAFEINRIGRIDLSMQRKPLTRQVWKNLSGVVRRDRLDWTIDVELRTSQPGTFQHELEVDSQLVIQDIRVLKGGANRLVRWSRSPHPRKNKRDRIVLFLNTATDAELQNISIQMHTLRTSDAVRFPTPSFANAEVVESRVQLYAATSESPRIIGDALAEIDTRDTDDSAPGRLLGRFDWDESKPVPRFEFIAQSDPLESDRLWILSAIEDEQSGGQANLIRLIRFQNAMSSRAISFVVPGISRSRIMADLSGNEDAELTLTERGDSVHGTIMPTADESELVLAIHSAHPVDELVAGVAAIESATANVRNSYLVLDPRLGVAASASQANEVRISELPNWIMELPFSDEFNVNTMVSQQASDVSSWKLAQPTTTAESAAQIRSVSHSIKVSSDGMVHGRSRILVSAVERHRFLVKWPESVNQRAIHVNGTGVVARSLPDNRMEVPIAEGPPLHEVLIWWSQQLAVPRFFGSMELVTPTPEQWNVERSLVSFEPQMVDFLVPRSGLEKLAQLDYLDQTYESLRANFALIQPLLTVIENAESDVKESGIADKTPTSTERQEAHDSPVRNILQRDVDLFRALLHASRDDIESARLKECAAFSKTLERYYPSQTLRRDIAPGSTASSPSLTAASLTGEPTTIWLIREPTIAWPTAGIAVLIALYVIRRLVRIESGDWLARHPFVGWSLLAILWWACFSPSVVGLVFLIPAVSSLVRRDESDVSHLHVDGSSVSMASTKHFNPS